jgi:2Fe-2S ferredoxin
MSASPPAPHARIIFELEDPHALTGKDDHTIELPAPIGVSVLDVALDHGINIEHACGGACACSTCHIYLEAGDDMVNEPDDAELDRVEQAPGLQPNSRLSCQTRIERPGTLKVRIPAWNRNAVKEAPH